MITIDDFAKLDIRIGKVLSAEAVPEADKLLKLVFDFGEEQRQIMAGIAEHTEDPETLIGKEIPVIVNLEPRKLRGYESHGMILATSDEEGIALLHPARDVTPGSSVG
ncbi:MAG: methionine--tRNA ligase subunit beta [Parcubacteria group bacterium]|nr:methionine--tRNA ligase subunit beta [Parcubacteria group bacterium]